MRGRKLPKGTMQQVTYQVPVDKGRGCGQWVGILLLIIAALAIIGAVL